MSKVYGFLGFCTSEEREPGSDIWGDVVRERPIYADITRNTRRFNNGDGINDNIVISNSFRVISDPYAFENLEYLKYFKWNNKYWEVTSTDIDYPAINFTVGGIWNGNVANP